MLSAEQLFRTLADETRLRVLALLHSEGELCVCELTHALALSQPKISRHLATLRESGLVNDRRQGLWVFYRLSPELPQWTADVLNTALQGVCAQSPYATDRATLCSMPNRPGAACCA